MTAQSKTTIKSYFESGDRPTEAQFINLIDSYQDYSASLTAIASASTGAVGLQLLACVTSASAASIVSSTIVVSAGAVQFLNSNRILGNVSAGVGTELSSTDLTFSGSTVNLATTAVSAGTYAAPTITIDTKGRITSATAGSGAVFTLSFTSTDQTITAAGSLTLAHSLGVAPKLRTYELVCQTGEAGFSAGDVVEVTCNNNTQVERGFSQWSDSTNINIRYGTAASTFQTAHKTTGTQTALTNANWKLRVKAWA